jgi:hypothetical protein
MVGAAVTIRALQGGDAALAADLARLRQLIGSVTASQEQALLVQIEMWVALAAGSLDAVLRSDSGTGEPLNRLLGYRSAAHAAIWTQDLDRARAIRASIERLGLRGRWTRGITTVLEAGIAALEGRAAEAAALYRDAGEQLDHVGARLDVLLAHLDRLAVATDPAGAAAAAAAARPVIEELGARALGSRLEALLAATPDAQPTPSTNVDAAATRT